MDDAETESKEMSHATKMRIGYGSSDSRVQTVQIVRTK